MDTKVEIPREYSAEENRAFMQTAIDVACKSVKNGGGPFGAVIVKDGKIIAASSNSVTSGNDPTAHAEVNTIRQACQALQTFDLNGCTLYSSCEPCPMCLGAIYWSHIGRIYYGGTRRDAAEIGFRDEHIYEELAKPMDERSLEFVPLMRKEALEPFRNWTEHEDKTEY